MAENFNDTKLLRLHKSLMKENCISEIGYDDFKKIFSEEKYTTPNFKKIDWKVKNRGMDKQALLTLIDYVVSPDYTVENKSTIIKIIEACFTFENEDILGKIQRSFKETFESFKNKNYKNSKIIEDIMKEIPV